MPFAHIASMDHWIRQAGSFLPVIAGLLSVVILFGCAIATWIAPPEKEDCIFHREVV